MTITANRDSVIYDLSEQLKIKKESVCTRSSGRYREGSVRRTDLLATLTRSPNIVRSALIWHIPISFPVWVSSSICFVKWHEEPFLRIVVTCVCVYAAVRTITMRNSQSSGQGVDSVTASTAAYGKYKLINHWMNNRKTVRVQRLHWQLS